MSEILFKNAGQRLKYYAKTKKISVRHIALSSGIVPSTLSSAVKSGNINSNHVDLILTNFSDINLGWLITGKGEMIEQNNIVSEPLAEYKKKNPLADIFFLIATVEELQMKVAALTEELSSIKESLNNKSNGKERS